MQLIWNTLLFQAVYTYAFKSFKQNEIRPKRWIGKSSLLNRENF